MGKKFHKNETDFQKTGMGLAAKPCRLSNSDYHYWSSSKALKNPRSTNYSDGFVSEVMPCIVRVVTSKGKRFVLLISRSCDCVDSFFWGEVCKEL